MNANPETAPLLSIQNLTIALPRGGDRPYAVQDVSYDIRAGEILCIVGESGSGKSTVARCIVRLIDPSGGEVLLDGEDIATMSARRLRPLRRRVQIVFQDPYRSLNPRRTVLQAIIEGPLNYGTARAAAVQRARQLMALVRMDPDSLERYPHQFSGGQRARIGIARALAVKPQFLVCDESVAALDVSIQAQVLNLFMKPRDELNLTYLFISHDLSVVRHLSDRVVIMYLGRVVEAAPASELFKGPQHPYAQALLANVPTISARKKRFAPLKGEIPSPLHPPSGCHFRTRCPYAFDRCRSESPALREVRPGHWAACHLR